MIPSGLGTVRRTPAAAHRAFRVVVAAAGEVDRRIPLAGSAAGTLSRDTASRSDRIVEKNKL